ncbi:MAG TPA: hypothetical protein VFV38_34460 [Ktedonobacteraceae bacterium]|nr:hypothetical protein [Ktedonobacteraceae bacterium]
MSDETSSFLLALVQEHHYELTASQLRRLHLEGVIERPIQDHPSGRGGSETVYPPGTGIILLALCERRHKTRLFSTLAWQLWWDEYLVPLTTIRQQLRQTIETWTRLQRTLAKPGAKTLSRFARKVLEKAVTYRFQDPALNQARKRVGSVSFDTFVRILFEAATGHFRAYADDYAGAREEEQRIMEKGFGLEQTPLDRALHLDWGAQLEQVLVELGNLLAEDPWMHWLDQASDEELLILREEWKLIQMAFLSFSTAMEEIAGKRSSGGRILYSLLGRISQKGQPFLLLCWGVLRQRLEKNAQEILQIARQWQEEYFPAYTALRQLQQEIPSSQALFSPNRMRVLIGNDRRREQHLSECRHFYQTHQEEVAAFWHRHPEWSQLWDQPTEPAD